MNRNPLEVPRRNPYVGGSGLPGTEEIDENKPAVQRVKAEGVELIGLYPTGTIFLRLQSRKKLDCLLAMYHKDQ